MKKTKSLTAKGRLSANAARGAIVIALLILTIMIAGCKKEESGEPANVIKPTIQIVENPVPSENRDSLQQNVQTQTPGAEPAADVEPTENTENNSSVTESSE